MSCNGCRVLRKGCSDSCPLRPCLQWIEGAEAQGHATVFVAKFFGRAGLLGFINAVAENQRPALFRSLLYEACGRTVNPIYGAVGLLWSGNWNVCSAAVETILRGGRLQNPNAAAAAAYGPMPNLPRPPPPLSEPAPDDSAAAAGLALVRMAADSKPVVVKREREEDPVIPAPVRRRRRAAPAAGPPTPSTPPLPSDDVIDLDLTLKVHRGAPIPAAPLPTLRLPTARSSNSSEGSVTSIDTNDLTIGASSTTRSMDLLHTMEAYDFHHRRLH